MGREVGGKGMMPVLFYLIKLKNIICPTINLSCSLKVQKKEWSPQKVCLIQEAGMGPEAAGQQALGDIDGSGAFFEKPDTVDDEYATDR